MGAAVDLWLNPGLRLTSAVIMKKQGGKSLAIIGMWLSHDHDGGRVDNAHTIATSESFSVQLSLAQLGLA